MSECDEQGEAPVFSVGDTFEVSAPANHDVEKLRVEIGELYGLAPHFFARFGPASITDEAGSQSYHCPVEAVDDEVLQGKFSLCLPAEGWCVYIGYFKAVA